MNFKTEQEKFWAGDFGSDYITRNQGDELLASNLNFFSKALSSTNKLKSCIEFGANIGMNIKAIKLLYSSIECSAIEINKDAAQQLEHTVDSDRIFRGSIFDYQPSVKFDLVLIKGVLIHIDPEELSSVYEKLVKSTNRYILVAEYYNPSPVEIPYRGHLEKLYKRDFAGEILDRHPDFLLRDYGFSYRRDPDFPQDDITWFLLEKK